MKRFEIKEFCGYEVKVTEEKESNRICVTYDLETERFSNDFYNADFDRNTVRGNLLDSLNHNIKVVLFEAFQQMIAGYYAQFENKTKIFTPENGEQVFVYIYEE